MKDALNWIAVLVICSVMVLGLREFIDEVNSNQAQLEAEKSYRFEKLTEFDFNKSALGTVYRDKETGIEYLYIWGGSGNGGPAITRLWKKGEQ